MSEPTHIDIRGARVHNLKNVDLSIPRDSLVVFTGVSGSGKSSLAFDTIYQEGQRRFMESLSSYARQFLGQMERPDVESVEGVSPTLSIDQKTVNRNPRSTVGTVTEIYDHVRLLFARLGTPHCPKCDAPVERLGVDDIVAAVLERFGGQKAHIYAPVVRERKGEYRKELQELARDGWLRARIDGEERRLDEEIVLARYEKHTIEVVVDRIIPRESDRTRLVEAIEKGLAMSEGIVVVSSPDEELTFATSRACAKHPELSFPELEPRLFSFNAPQGACPTCNGLGALEAFDLERLFDLSKPAKSAFLAFNDDGKIPFAGFDRDNLAHVVKQLKAPATKPLVKWPVAKLEQLVHGDPALIIEEVIHRPDGRVDRRSRPWRGLLGIVKMVWKYTSYSGFQAFRSRTPCPECEGARLSQYGRAVRFRGTNIVEQTRATVEDAAAFFANVTLEGNEKEVGELLIAEIRDRLQFLVEVGLGYLTLNRSAATLSGGEAQRIRLASQVGSALQGVTYVLDEPSIGLHPRDNQRLLTTLRRLQARGNSVLVVEHDAETIAAADYVVDVGPGAGSEGGEVVAAMSGGRFLRSNAPTAMWMRRERVIAMPDKRRVGNGKALKVRGANANNLKDVAVDFPLGTLTVVTGVSGSGKSSLVFGSLEPTVSATLSKERVPGSSVSVDGVKHVDKLIRISQQPIGRTPRSNPATYTGAFDKIRDLFAQIPESKARAYKRGRFSFNVAGGRCEACSGAGVQTVEMQFLPSVEVTCDVCNGKRYNAETLEISYRGHTIADVLKMTVGEGAEFFKNHRTLSRILDTLVSVGLGYIPLGQPSTTLSGGEAQRIKLASELHRPSTGQTLYLLDEPTTGLHFEDVDRLISAIQRLVDAGNSVIIVEHHTDIMKVADHLIDMGPEGGNAGGYLVGEGTPEHIATLDTPTGRALATLPEFGAVIAADVALSRKNAKRPAKRAKELVVKGARQHNLTGVDITIPHGTMTVITGPSGSGKTSLAFDTIFSEGQRQYVESLSTYARRFLGRMERAPVDRIEGLAPAIAIDQRAASRNPRSTVATVTEIHDVLRLLWARVGQPHCPECRREVSGRSPSVAAQWLAQDVSEAGWLVTDLRPVESTEERRDALVADGWSRLLQEGVEVRLETADALGLLKSGATLVIDRFSPAKAAASRVAEAISAGYAMGLGRARFVARESGVQTILNARPRCPEHGDVLPDEITPRHFSFNSQLGACTRCDGLGQSRQIDIQRVFPDSKDGFWDALDPRVRSVMERSARNGALIEAVLAYLKLKPDTPVSKWSPAQRKGLLFGLPGQFAIHWSKRWGRSVKHVDEEREWAGIVPILEGWNAQLDWLTIEAECPSCKGGRLRPAVLAVDVSGIGIDTFSKLTVDDALSELGMWSFEGSRAVIAERPVMELQRRLAFLSNVGLGYLSLDRGARTLSGGEAQRIRLASQLGVGLTGVIYVLDEPTIGLHTRDTERLLATLEDLRDQGNTLVVVEHDPDTINRADRVIDLGPGAGAEGGRLLAMGTPQEVRDTPGSVTGAWLSGRETMPDRPPTRKARKGLRLTGATGHNLKSVNVTVPTGLWVAVTGVSGSGKSSLIMDTLVPALRESMGTPDTPLPHKSLAVRDPVDRLVVVDQSPLGRTPRSTPATYTKVMDAIRKLYADTPGSRARGWKPGRFSFNSKGGRCETCEGRGSILVEMHFLPDVWVVCDTCKGRRFNRDTLAVTYRGRSIADALGMRIDEAAELFTHHRSLSRKLTALVDVGLGYISLGQPATTLSGGEAQRVKLAAELTSRKGHALYVLDEPTTGLHLTDVRKLVTVLHRLVTQGHTVITIEHHLDILKQADWVLDIGPEGGFGGGNVVGEGPPSAIARLDTPTGKALASLL